MADNDYLQPAGAFLDWFRAWPGTTFHSDIEIVDLRSRGAGRGIVAKADIAPDTVLFTIPRKAILCSATSELANLIPGIAPQAEEDDKEEEAGDDDAPGQDPWTSLILIMIYEFLRGDKSPWKPYFDVLPAVFDTPMFWSDDELKALQASPVVGRVGRDEADRMIKTKVLPVIREHSSVFFGDGSVAADMDDDALIQLSHRVGSTIMAYSFSLEKDDDEEEEEEEGENEDVEMQDGEHEHGHGPGCCHGCDDDAPDGWVEDKDDQQPLGMVPMADMLNADAEFNAHINHGADALTAVAVRPIKAGEEILNYYGPLSNGELLRRYGYTTEAHAFFDAVDLPWELVQEKLVAAAVGTGTVGLSSADVAKIADALDDDELEDPIMLDRDFDEDETTGRLTAPASGRVLSELPPVLGKQARAFAKPALKRLQKKRDKQKEQLPPVNPKKNGKYGKYGKGKPPVAKEDLPKSDKEVAAAGIAAALAARLAAYPTTLEQDEAQFAALSSAAAGSHAPADSRLYSALRVRIGEKRLLKEAVALADAALAAETSDAGKGKKNDRAREEEEEPSGKRQKDEELDVFCR